MKKSLLMLGVAVAALASCTQNEVVDIAESNVIKFDNAFVGKATKAVTAVTTDNIQSFYVYGYEDDEPILENENVYLQNGLWAYDNIQKWNQNATAYAFAAYSNGGLNKGDGSLDDVTFTKDTPQLEIKDYVADGNSDLLASISSTTLADANEKVAFTFDHVLSMVKFTIKSGLGNDKSLAISDLKVQENKIQNKATLTYTTGTPSWQFASPAEYAILEEEALTATTEAAGEVEFTVIPQEVSGGLTVTFTATITPEGEDAIVKPFTATISADNAKWTAGNRYNYILTITGIDMGIIEFNKPVVDDWNNVSDTDIQPSPAQP